MRETRLKTIEQYRSEVADCLKQKTELEAEVQALLTEKDKLLSGVAKAQTQEHSSEE